MRESSIAFGTNDGLVGTITLPEASSTEAAGIGFVLLNAGVVHRVGPHRINVRIARQLAAGGIPSIRLDLAGHGDSARPTGQHSSEAQAIIDIRSAMDALGTAARVSCFAIYGHGSGAYHAYRTTLSDERVVGLLMFDAFRYPTIRTYAYRYLRALRQPQLPRRLLGFLRRGVMSPGRRPRAPAGRNTAEPPVPEFGQVDSIPSKASCAAGLKVLLGRGVQVVVIYSGGDIRNDNYPNEFRDTFAPFGIADRIRAVFLPDSDHQASALVDQAELMRLIVAWSNELVSDRTAAAERPA